MKIAPTLAACLALAGCTATQMSEPSGPVSIQILALNDFHGALLPDNYESSFASAEGMQSAQLGGAARLGALLATLREEEPNTLVVAAGDLIGASPVISQQFLDEPAIVALSMAGLDVASVGNHEFDRGIAELQRMQNGGCEQFTPRVPCALEPFAGAGFTYLAGNVADERGTTLFPGAVLREIGGAKIGFIGLTLKDTPLLVSSSAVAGYNFGDEAEAANLLAGELTEQGADGVILLLHEGARVDPKFNTSGCPGLSGSVVPILERLDPAIGLVVSGHTHEAYSCEVNGRTLTSAGRNGAFVTRIQLDLDTTSDTILALSAENLPVTEQAGEHAAIGALVSRYAEAGAEVANRPVGSWQAEPDALDDCLDTSAQRLVADSQLAATLTLANGPAHFGFVNTGGVRTALPAGTSGDMTFGDIFAMQPFANTTLLLEMTGSDIRAALEEQFCEASDGSIRPCFSMLIPSSGFAYRFDTSKPAGERVVAMELHGAPLDPAATYRVAVNNFIAGGGDGFASFTAFEPVDNAGGDLDALEAWLLPGATIPACGRVRDLTLPES